jgi:hypothetical protein
MYQELQFLLLSTGLVGILGPFLDTVIKLNGLSVIPVLQILVQKYVNNACGTCHVLRSRILFQITAIMI